jgi:protoporphyrinogen IX oxidase
MTVFFLMKALHVIAVISWMAGLLYLPRLFVYHSDLKDNSDSAKLFIIMEKRLLRFIMNPAMVITFITGFILFKYIGFSQGWVHAKLLLVLFMAGFHGFLAKYRKNFENNQNNNSEKFYRIINEIPTILMILIVFLVIFKPF